MSIPSDVSSQHFLIALKTSTGEYNIRSKQIVKETIILPDLQTTDGTGIVGQKSDGLGLVVNVAVLKLPNMLEHFLDDGITAAVGENEVLVGIEFK